MSNPADTGTAREGDPYAEIAALRQRVAELERELDAARKVCDYADHHPMCPQFNQFDLEAIKHPCDCGLNLALAAYRATQTKEPTNEK